MKTFYKQSFSTPVTIGEEYTSLDLKDSIQKTRIALDIAYAGFDNAVDAELIDSYIYEINALQLRYKYLISLADLRETEEENLSRKHSPIHALVSHVFG